MTVRKYAVCLILLLATSKVGRAQTSPSPHLPANDDFSQEAAVIESMSTSVVFNNDGNFTRDQASRVRVQTDAGVQTWGLLSFPFESATQTVEIDYVRVRKVDGSTVVTPPDNVQDLDSEITRSAPFYSDLREKRVAVKGLGKGDVLEYAAHWRTTKPLIPGQFWFQYSFHQEGVVLDEHLELSVPADRMVKVKGPTASQTVATATGNRVYTWHYAKLKSAKETGTDERKQVEIARGRVPPPDVQISSFQSWEEVGRWYWNLQKERVEPTPAIRAKAAELTKGVTDDATKLNILYSFVSTQYRYIGIAFGIGRYQPHAAEDVLTNNYGDCKDKQTLLASLLQASGITLYPALINSGRKLDPDVPSPAQFDHLIGYLPHGKDAVWLDTTPQVAPFGFLLPKLRDKPALVVSGDKSIGLLTTPADPPSPGTESFKIEGKLSNDGNFEAKVEDTSRGDSEVALRAAFRQVAQPQWKDLMQRISYAMGYEGTVSNVIASNPEAINEPFHIAYSYSRKDYPDWKSDQRIVVPGSPFYMPPVRDDASDPLWLGGPLQVVSDSKVELPPGNQPRTPPKVDLKYDFAEYHASYSEDHGVLIAKRQLLTKLREVPVAEFSDYRSFVKNVQNDINQYVYMQTSPSTAPVTPAADPVNSPPLLGELRNLPDSSSQDAVRLEADARVKMTNRDIQGAVSSLYRAVSTDPKFTRAWVLLGVLLFVQKQADAGTEAFRKAMATDPTQPAIPKALGLGLMGDAKFEEAVPVWQDYIRAHPEDVDGPANLASCLLKMKRYSEAAGAYESALKIKPDRPNLQASLGSAYLLAGDKEKAGEAFSKLAEMKPEEGIFNDVAYEMAVADFKLPLALDYAKRAVRLAEKDSQEISLPALQIDDVTSVFKMAAYWDTLGWVEERMSNLEEAESHLRASWRLTQDGVVAGHLCHLYKRVHKVELAAQMCRMAIFRMSMSRNLSSDDYQTEVAAAKENLNRLTGGAGKSTGSTDAAGLVVREREFKLPRFLPGTESAEFFVLLASDGKSKNFKVEDVKFISGSDKMKLQGKQLKSIDFKVPAPYGVPVRFVWRGILGCYQYSGCSFATLDPASVHSLN